MNDANKRKKKISFKSNASHISCISKVNNTLMPMYNLLQYSEKHSMTSGSLWNYHRDKINDDDNETKGLETG